MIGPPVLRHAQLGIKQPADATESTLLEPETFSAQGKMQPFNVSVSSSCLLVLDLHAHCSTGQRTGYLAGQWDMNAQNLAITHAFPCLVEVTRFLDESFSSAFHLEHFITG